MLDETLKFKILKLYLRNDYYSVSSGTFIGPISDSILLSRYRRYTIFLIHNQIRHLHKGH